MKKIKDENSKEKILSAATKLFAQKGFNAVSIREICKDAGVNICMISYYFGGKGELYQAIMDNLIERQTKYARTFMDFDKDPKTLPKDELIELLLLVLDKFIDFFYADVSSDLIILMLKEQQNTNFIANAPALNYFRKLIAAIINKDENDRLTIYKTLFLISQVNSPRILPGFSLRLLNQQDFTDEDIKIIKDNAKMYVNTFFKEAKI